MRRLTLNNRLFDLSIRPIIVKITKFQKIVKFLIFQPPRQLRPPRLLEFRKFLNPSLLLRTPRLFGIRQYIAQ